WLARLDRHCGRVISDRSFPIRIFSTPVILSGDTITDRRGIGSRHGCYAVDLAVSADILFTNESSDPRSLAREDQGFLYCNRDRIDLWRVLETECAVEEDRRHPACSGDVVDATVQHDA